MDTGNKAGADDNLQGRVCFQQYFSNRQQNPETSGLLQTSQGSSSSQDDSFTPLSNVVENIEFGDSEETPTMENEEIDFSALFPAGNDCQSPSTSSGSPKKCSQFSTEILSKRQPGTQHQSVSSNDTSLDSALREELLSSETQNLLEEYGETLGYTGGDGDSGEESPFGDRSMDSEFASPKKSGKRMNGSGKQRGRPKKPKKTTPAETEEDESAILGVPAEWEEEEEGAPKGGREGGGP